MTHDAKRPYRRATETRRHVLDVAARLFYADGIRAVGIDRLAQEAQVTTATLYRLFGSKEGLVAAYLRRADQEWFDWLEQAVAAGGLAQFFDELDARTREPCYRGCAFSMALAEYPSDSEIHSVAVEHKRRVRARLREMVAAASCADPEVTAEQLMLVMDGMSTSAAECAAGSPPGVGPALARRLLGLS
ncbi:MAG: TetR/AcrR family transcriptional regulator [Dehalococcoidia bacterium]